MRNVFVKDVYVAYKNSTPNCFFSTQMSLTLSHEGWYAIKNKETEPITFQIIISFFYKTYLSIRSILQIFFEIILRIYTDF